MTSTATPPFLSGASARSITDCSACAVESDPRLLRRSVDAAEAVVVGLELPRECFRVVVTASVVRCRDRTREAIVSFEASCRLPAGSSSTGGRLPSVVRRLEAVVARSTTVVPRVVRTTVDEAVAPSSITVVAALSTEAQSSVLRRSTIIEEESVLLRSATSEEESSVSRSTTRDEESVLVSTTTLSSSTCAVSAASFDGDWSEVFAAAVENAVETSHDDASTTWESSSLLLLAAA
mmetsp:Transcript_29757/g.91106  ORF Transcript_29757/g.91106 Transcript_29757/m.91106 type:complete len:236 (+) Transcript_29757:3-710(+)